MTRNWHATTSGAQIVFTWKRIREVHLVPGVFSSQYGLYLALR